METRDNLTMALFKYIKIIQTIQINSIQINYNISTRRQKNEMQLRNSEEGTSELRVWTKNLRSLFATLNWFCAMSPVLFLCMRHRPRENTSFQTEGYCLATTHTYTPGCLFSKGLWWDWSYQRVVVFTWLGVLGLPLPITGLVRPHWKSKII